MKTFVHSRIPKTLALDVCVDDKPTMREKKRMLALALGALTGLVLLGISSQIWTQKNNFKETKGLEANTPEIFTVQSKELEGFKQAVVLEEKHSSSLIDDFPMEEVGVANVIEVLDNQEAISTAVIFQPEASVRYHTVQNGETLSSISKNYYGTIKRWEDIYEANREIIPNKNHIRPGLKLVIPE